MTATKGARRKRRAMRRARRIARKALTILMAAALLCAAVLIGMEVWTWLKGVSVRNKLDDLYPAAASERLSGALPRGARGRRNGLLRTAGAARRL